MATKAVDWERVGRLCGQVDMVALQGAATLLYGAFGKAQRPEFGAVCDAVAALETLSMLAKRGGDPPWAPLPRAVRDEMRRDGP